MKLEEVVGNSSLKKLLNQSVISNRIGHAYIIEGSKGSGRMTISKAFASAILKTEDCEKHPDFAIVTNQRYDSLKKQENILVDTIRAMKKDVYIKPYMAERKIYVIPKADTMQAPAQNSLLKVFEEPPEYCTIILLAENSNLFLPTILSRAVVLRTEKLTCNQVSNYLENQKGLSQSQAVSIGIMSGGAIGKALELIENKEGFELRNQVFKHINNLIDGNYKDMYDFVRFLKGNKGEIKFIFEILLSWSRDIMKLKLMGATSEIVNIDREKELKALCGKITRQSALRLSEITVEYQGYIEQNANYPIAILCMVTEYWEEIHG